MNLIMKDHADKKWLHHEERVQKMYAVILTVCVLGMLGITLYASLTLVLPAPSGFYALVDQNGEE